MPIEKTSVCSLLTAKSKDPRPKSKAQSTKFEVRSSKYKVQSSKFKVQSSKFKAQFIFSFLSCASPQSSAESQRNQTLRVNDFAGIEGKKSVSRPFLPN